MSKIAIIENGVVANVIMGDEEFASTLGDNAIYIGEQPYIGIGCTYSNGQFSTTEPSVEEIALHNRNLKLIETDFIVPLTDFPRYSEWITYRQELRDWPTTENFPNTVPQPPFEITF